MIKDAINKTTRVLPAWPLYLIGFLPAAYWIYLALTNQFGPEPQIALEHALGEFALQLMVLTLLITPLRDIFRVNLIKYRRALGLLAFYYVVLHLTTYLILDHQVQWLGWSAVISDITKRPFIIIGVIGLLLLLPLAFTSNDFAIRRIGPIIWRRIHWLTYPAIILGAAHYVMLTKVWEAEPLIYFFVTSLLILYRYRGLFRLGYFAS